ncbi:MAG: hypothetical protein Q7T61_12235 [Caulobacter sp.]|nr:hypothetical protein [Caulobacter sp.]
MADARRITGWVLAVPGGIWTLGALLFGLALALATDGDSPSTAGEKLFIVLLFGGMAAIPGIVALVVGIVLLRKRPG